MKKILKEYAKAIIVVAILVIVCDFLVALPPYIVKQVVDIDFTRKDISQVIVFFIFIYTSIHLARLIVKYIRDFMINEVICKILKDIRKTLFDKILRFKMITFNKYNSSELYTRLTSDVNNLFTLFFGFLYGILNNVLYIIFMIIMMFVADINVAVIGAFIVVLISSIVYKFTKILGKLDNEILEKRDLEHKEFSELYNKNKLTYLFKLQNKNIYKTGELIIDDDLKTVTVEGNEVKLTPTEYNILKFLTKNKGIVFSIEQIYQNVWDDEAYAAENIIAVHIRHIREKIEINPREPRYLKVIWGIGYKIEKIN